MKNKTTEPCTHTRRKKTRHAGSANTARVRDQKQDLGRKP